jgi:hypothetical protein
MLIDEIVLVLVIACGSKFHKIGKDNEQTSGPTNVGYVGCQAIPRIVRG